MFQTNIEYFNHNLRLLINDILKIFPDLTDGIKEYYSELLENESCNNDKYIKRYMRKMATYKEVISKKDNSLFDESVFVLKNVDFKELWERDTLKDADKEVIWDYLQTLFVIGETIVNDSENIKKLVENFKKIREDNSKEGESISEELKESINKSIQNSATGDIENSENSENTENTENTEILNMIKNLSNKTKEQPPELNEELLNNGLIGNLAKELAEDINLDDFNLNIDENNANVNDVFSNLISGDNPMKFMNLFQNVVQKIQSKLTEGNIDQSKLVDEAQQMMGMLGNNNPLFDNLMNTAKNQAASSNANTQQNNNDSYNNPTRDRLRKKLEQRKKK